MTVDSPEGPRKKQKLDRPSRQRTFFDVDIGGKDAGRIVRTLLDYHAHISL